LKSAKKLKNISSGKYDREKQDLIAHSTFKVSGRTKSSNQLQGDNNCSGGKSKICYLYEKIGHIAYDCPEKKI